ncbi:hypothetical protein HMPREF0531_12907 [Lactiplantibacillus plantarum subsp. plantarum ATCC 14917 = JCM 1149 = CGMCC 1.2437]|nr:hypothetical protein HMPREF0531_12907 [Lactiplantibacillus plantarum subsp. plantarum ATCC 14917 = JCM 1149 = CGMCC 1.2437]
MIKGKLPLATSKRKMCLLTVTEIGLVLKLKIMMLSEYQLSGTQG